MATPTLTPTPDLRNVQELFDQSQQLILNSKWSEAIDTLLALRKVDSAFRTVDVDGMMFLALRNRGREKITNGDLEGGIYDLTLAGNFGPLDAEAKGLLTWSSMYITGASFWGIDWAQAVSYFSQVAPQYPNLRDGSGMTAAERYREALYELGNTLANQGKWCKAVEQYQASLSIAPNAEVELALGQAANQCNKSEPQQPTAPAP
jgi:tetratricopeptide (TPR) repeat protein